MGKGNDKENNINAQKRRITSAIGPIDNQRNELMSSVALINEERDNYINSTVEEYISEDYIKRHYPRYSTYILPGTVRGAVLTADQEATRMKTFIETELTLDDKISIIAQYTVDSKIKGDSSPKAKLEDIIARKKENKLRYIENAREILKMYGNIIEENNEVITTLNEEITEKEKALRSIDVSINDIIKQPDAALNYSGKKVVTIDKKEAIDIYTKQKESLGKEIERLREELAKYKNLQAYFIAIIEKKKREFEQELQDQNLFVYDRKGQQPTVNNDSQNASNVGQTINSQNGNPNRGHNSSQLNSSDTRAVAKSMLNEFLDSSPEKQRELLDSVDNRGILDMSRDISGLDKARLKTTLEERIDDLPKNSVTFGGQNISKAELKNPESISESTLTAIRKEIDEFNSVDISERTVDEIEEFEEKLRYIKTSLLIYEIGRARGLSRIFEHRNKQNVKIYDLSKSIARYAGIKNFRMKARNEWLNQLRNAAGRESIDVSNTNPLARKETGHSFKDPTDNQ